MWYVFFLFSLIVYVFSCMSLEFISKPQLELTAEERAETMMEEWGMQYDEIIVEHWGSIPRSMLTLLLFIPWPTASIFLPMCRHKPALIFFFLCYMLLVSVALMNLVTAIIVQTSFEQAASDKHVAKLHKAGLVQKLMPELREMFLKLDDNGDGAISLDEFGKCPDKVREKLCDLFNTDDLVELFEILDVDGSGSVSIDEFCDEMTKLSTTVESVEHIRLMKQMHIIRNEVMTNQNNSTNIMQMLYGLSERLDPAALLSPRLSASPTPSKQNTLEQHTEIRSTRTEVTEIRSTKTEVTENRTGATTPMEMLGSKAVESEIGQEADRRGGQACCGLGMISSAAEPKTRAGDEMRASPSPFFELETRALPSPSNQNTFSQRMSAIEDRLAKVDRSVEDRFTKVDATLLEMKQAMGHIVQALNAENRYSI
jgi:Ca2+-binding EF-hand superfamily protein